MSTDYDFKDMWNKQQIPLLDAKELLAKANDLKKNIRSKMIIGNLLLIVTILFIGYIVWYFQPEKLTTKIGVIFTFIAIIMFIFSSIGLIKLLVKNNISTTNAEYLKQLIEIKQKQEFIQSTIMNLYFIFLSIGILLYMIEYAARMTPVGYITTYSITIAWLGFNYFYLRPKSLKKQQKKVNDLIEKIKEMNSQMKEEL